jgi:hypothetical protein
LIGLFAAPPTPWLLDQDKIAAPKRKVIPAYVLPPPRFLSGAWIPTCVGWPRPRRLRYKALCTWDPQ